MLLRIKAVDYLMILFTLFFLGSVVMMNLLITGPARKHDLLQPAGSVKVEEEQHVAQRGRRIRRAADSTWVSILHISMISCCIITYQTFLNALILYCQTFLKTRRLRRCKVY